MTVMTGTWHHTAGVPLVSVQTITYNHAPYIRDCIEGVLAQRSDFPFEYLIGEDCSTDGTREIVQEYAKRYPGIIRLITSDSNVGARANVRRTRAAAQGKYIALCEGDDYWHDPTKLQRQIDWLEAHPDCGLIHSEADFEYVTTGKRIRNIHRERGGLVLEPDLFQSLIGSTYRIVTCTACLRRSAIQQAMAQPTYAAIIDKVPMGDTPLWLELSRFSRFGYFDDSTATYRVLPESSSKSRDARKQLIFHRGMIRLRAHYMEAYGVPAAFRRQVLAKMGRPRLATAAAIGDREAIEELSRLMVSAQVTLNSSERIYRTCVRLPLGQLLVRALSLVFRGVAHLQRRVQAVCPAAI